MKRALLLLLMLPAASCASAQAKSPAERPNLEVPPPPPRTIEPLPVEAPPEPVPDLPSPPASPPSRPRPQPSPPARETTKPDPKPEQPAEPPAAAPQPAAPQLRTPAVPDGPAAARQIREVLDRAARMLSSIDYQTLSDERKSSYNTAKNFIKEGEEALKAANHLLAKELADKAERLANQLHGR